MASYGLKSILCVVVLLINPLYVFKTVFVILMYIVSHLSFLVCLFYLSLRFFCFENNSDFLS